MTDDVFERRSRRFCEALAFLERMRETPWEVFEREPEKYASTERFLQIAVEILDDLGTHLVARHNLGAVGRYRDVPDALALAGVIDNRLSAVWRRIIGFCNPLVDDYLIIDRAIVYEVLQERLGDLRALHRALIPAQFPPS
jgi:uncharacterized protein YutE (UPF0331/DUF86 family)